MELTDKTVLSLTYAPVGYLYHADMLCDDRRNKAYDDAIHAIVENQKTNSIWVDIGTGSGLLASLVAKHVRNAGKENQNKIIAFEVSEHLCEVAKKTAEKNGLSYLIDVHHCHSTAVSHFDQGSKADYLVSELLDTGLLGEGVLNSLRHAKSVLARNKFKCIPDSAVVYGCICESQNCGDRLTIQNSDFFQVPQKWAVCDGLSTSDSIHVVFGKNFKPLSDENIIFEFDFCNLSDRKIRSNTLNFQITQEGTGNCFVYWWVAYMDQTKSIFLSTKPGLSPPPDHWRQAVYYFVKPLEIQKGDSTQITAFHDDNHIWFKIEDSITPYMKGDYSHPLCDCGFHTSYDRRAIQMINDKKRTKIFKDCFRELFNSKKKNGLFRVLQLSNGFLLPLLAAEIHPLIIISIVEPAPCDLSIYERNNVRNQMQVLPLEFDDLLLEDNLDDVRSEQYDAVMGEPFFTDFHQDWGFESLMQFILYRSALFPATLEKMKTIPSKAVICSSIFQCGVLARMHNPIAYVEGVDMSAFNELHSNQAKDNNLVKSQVIYSSCLHDYPFKLLSDSAEVLSIDVQNINIAEQLSSTVLLKVLEGGFFHGIAMWIEYDLDGSSTYKFSSDPNSSIYHHQGLVFIADSFEVYLEPNQKISITACLHESQLFIRDVTIMDSNQCSKI